MKTTGVVFVVAAAMALPVVGCKSQKTDPKVVVTSIFPVYDLVKRVGGDKVKVQLLLTPGASAHDFNPSTKQMKQASRAGSAFIIGLGLDEWTTKLVKSASKKARIIELGERVKAVKFDFKRVGGSHDEHKGHKEHKDHDEKGHKDDDHDKKGHKDDDHDKKSHKDEHHDKKGHKDEHKKGKDEHKGHDDHDDHDDHDKKGGHAGHHHDGLDPHIWLSVPKAMAMVQVIADELSKLQPKHEKFFRANATKVLEQLKALHMHVKKTVAGFSKKKLVTFHGSFGYFAVEYGLEIVAVIELYPGRNPSPAYLKKVLATIKGQPIAALYTEPQLDPRPAKALAAEAKLPLKELDPIGGVKGRDSYEALIRFNLQQLAETMK